MQAKFHKPSTFVISVYLFCCAHCKLSEANYRSANFRIRLQKIHYLLTSHFFSLSRKFRMPYLMQFYNVCINMSKILSLRLAHTASMWTLLDFIQEELTTFTEAQYEAMLSLTASREIQADLQIKIKTLENFSLSFKTDKR